jgi:membrane protein YqaA with SNARE-associated domain
VFYPKVKMLAFLSPVLESYGLVSVIVSTFLSYSILPLPSEFTVLLTSGVSRPYLVFFAAMLGSTCGSVLNYFMGKKGKQYLLKQESKRYRWARKNFEKHGGLGILLFSWLPILGDPLIILAGALHMNFNKFMIYSTLAKMWYFILIIFVGINVSSWLGL